MTDLRIHAQTSPSAAPASEPVVVRILGEADRNRLARLAARDSAPIPSGRVLGAEVAGALTAAVSLSDGRVVADPFRPSAAAVEMLRLRTGQLDAIAHPAGNGRIRRVIDGLRRGHAHAGLAGSPPSAGGRPLQM